MLLHKTWCTISTPIEGTPVLENATKPKKDKVKIVGEDKVETPVNDGTWSQKCQANVPAPLAKEHDATKIKEAKKDKPKETKLTPKLKELDAIQAVVTLLEFGTPSSQTRQRPRIDATPLQFSMPSPNSFKVEEVITYEDVSLDEFFLSLTLQQ